MGWSQERLAGLVGVGSTTILKWERGQRISALDITVTSQVLEAAGIEYAVGAQPGVKLKAKGR